MAFRASSPRLVVRVPATLFAGVCSIVRFVTLKYQHSGGNNALSKFKSALLRFLSTGSRVCTVLRSHCIHRRLQDCLKEGSLSKVAAGKSGAMGIIASASLRLRSMRSDARLADSPNLPGA